MNYVDKKILVQYSGGKDSTACLIKLVEEKAYVEAIHFTHKYAYSVPTEEAKRICSEFEVKLHIIDISAQISELLLNDFKGRPCRACKGIMDKITVKMAQKFDFNYICVGDTASDKTLMERIKQNGDRELSISKYFNKNVPLPDDIFVLRPFIKYSNDAIFSFLKKRSVCIKRVNDTGDKYFEYSREGCPLQFKDYGVCYTKQLMQSLYLANLLCSEFATKKGIRAAIHMPSETIITIPKGYEKQCKDYLISNGLLLKNQCLVKNINDIWCFSISIYEEICNIQAINEIFVRFFERLSESITESNVTDSCVVLKTCFSEISVQLMKGECRLIGMIKSLEDIKDDFLESLFVELFHTYDFSLKNMKHSRYITIDRIFAEIINSRYLADKLYGSKVIRSNSIETLSIQQLSELKNIGIHDIIDLRKKDSLISQFANEVGIKYHKIPFVLNYFANVKRSSKAEDIVNSYLLLTDQFELCRNVFSVMARAEHGILIFCKYGRDRTGIIVMILELLCEVPMDIIIKDYLMSDLYLNANQYLENIYDKPNSVPVIYVSKFLEKYGSAKEYLKTIGIHDDDIHRLRELLNYE